MLSTVCQRRAHLLDAKIETVFEIDGGVLTPNFAPQLLAGDERSRPFQESREHAKRLELELDGSRSSLPTSAEHVVEPTARQGRSAAPAGSAGSFVTSPTNPSIGD
jgi:hypothetical protein